MSLYDQYQKDRETSTTGGLYAKFLADRNPAPKGPTLVDRIKNYAQDSANTVTTFNKAIASPWQTIQKSPEPFTEPYIAGTKKAGEGLYQVAAEPGVANKVAGTAKLISGLAEAAFSPLTGLFKIAENTPGLKQVADTINIPFTASGFVGSWSTGKAIDWIPDSILPKESKDIIKGPLQEVGALAGQIVIGGKIMKNIERYASEGKIITPEEAKKIVAESTSVENKIPITTPKSLYAEYRKSQGYEPYTPSDQLPTIDFGPKVKETLPVIQVGESIKLTKTPDGKYTYEPINSTPTQKQTILPPTRVIETPPETKVATPLPERAPGTTKLGYDVNAEIVKKGFESLPENELAKYDPITKVKTLADITQLMTDNIEQAKEIAKGKAPVPTGIQAQPLFNAIEKYAIEKGDIELLRELAKSPVANERSLLAQQLGSSGYNNVADVYSPVKVIKDLQKVRESKMEKTTKKKADVAKIETVKEIKDKIPKPTKQSWSDFVEQIKCGY